VDENPNDYGRRIGEDEFPGSQVLASSRLIGAYGQNPVRGLRSDAATGSQALDNSVDTVPGMIGFCRTQAAFNWRQQKENLDGPQQPADCHRLVHLQTRAP
jgi:hypothetical protein